MIFHALDEDIKMHWARESLAFGSDYVMYSTMSLDEKEGEWVRVLYLRCILCMYLCQCLLQLNDASTD